MSNTTCLLGPPFSIAGENLFVGSEVTFQFVFDNPADKALVLVYEWYLDQLIVGGLDGALLTKTIPCGSHTVGGRILTTAGWSGIKTMSFQSCASTVLISGPGAIEEGSTGFVYSVIATFADGTTKDLTGQYTFSSSEGTFSGNTLTIPLTSGGQRNIAITATKGTTVITRTVIVSHRYYNTVQSGQFARNNCAPNYSGSAVTYTVAGGTFSSLISQNDANELALNDINQNGQNYANNQGTCLAPSYIQYANAEQASPYADSNLQLKDNGVVVKDLFTSSSGNLLVMAGHSFSAEAYSNNPSTGRNSKLRLVVTKNSTVIFDQQVSNQTAAASVAWPGPVDSGATYVISASSSADGSPVSLEITGDMVVYERESKIYRVMATYQSGAVTDISADYNFSSTIGTFSGNVLNVPGNTTPNEQPRAATITATSKDNPSSFISKSISVQEPVVALNNFDFLAIRFHWFSQGGTDLDIRVGYENTGVVAYDNKYVGYNNNGSQATIPLNTNPPSNAYLWWASDNVLAEGYECVLVGIKKFINDNPSLPDIIQVGLYAVWFGPVLSGDFTVELATYLGGTMTIDAEKNFINTGGDLKSSNVFNLNTKIHNQDAAYTSAYKVGVLKFNKVTQTATIEIG